jgi:hypothetical protein
VSLHHIMCMVMLLPARRLTLGLNVTIPAGIMSKLLWGVVEAAHETQCYHRITSCHGGDDHKTPNS